MTMNRKQELISTVVEVLSQYLEIEKEEIADEFNEDKPIEMLTIKECTAVIKGLSEHTVRQLVAQNKIQYIRTGQGKRGKILVSKSSLLNYLGGAA